MMDIKILTELTTYIAHRIWKRDVQQLTMPDRQTNAFIEARWLSKIGLIQYVLSDLIKEICIMRFFQISISIYPARKLGYQIINYFTKCMHIRHLYVYFF